MFPLPLRVSIALGANLTADPATWTWTDITAYVRPRIQISRGRPDELGQTPPGSCRLRVNNSGGRFVVRNPMGPWYPLLRRGCPLRVEVQVNGVWFIRFTGFIAELPVTFVPGSVDTYVDLVASGITRRLGQGSGPVLSTPVRYIPTTSPVAYWPLEEGRLAAEGSALVGTQPMRPFTGAHPSGSVVTFTQWGRGDLAPWLYPALSRSGNAGLTAIWAPVTMPSTVTRWTVDFMYRSGTDAGDATVDVNPSYLGGSLGWPQLLLEPSLRNVLVAMNGEPEISGTAEALFDGQPHHVRWDVTQSGTKVLWTVHVDGEGINGGITSGNMTLPSMQTLAFTASAQAGADIVQGHIAVWTSPPSLASVVAAAFGYAGEVAADRMVRLCAEAGVPFVVGGQESEAMGSQALLPLLTLLRQAEDADGGILYERTDGRLAYLRRVDRYNRSVDLALTYRQLADSFTPTDDDRFVRNDVTMTRTSGGSAQVVDQAHIDAEGRYADQASINALADGVLQHHAGWRVHMGTINELRHPELTLNMRNPHVTPAVVTAWLGVDIGSRVTVADPPPELSVTRIDQVVEGYDEVLDHVAWTATLHCSPASGWDVATVDGDLRLAADGSTVAVALGSTDTSLLLASTPENGPWTQDPTDFPLAMEVGGERVTASGIEQGLLDEFGRAVPGWGSPTVGPAWVAPVVDSHVNGSLGVFNIKTYSHATCPVQHVDFDIVVRYIRLSATPTGNSAEIQVRMRYVDDNNYVAARLFALTSGDLTFNVESKSGGAAVPPAVFPAVPGATATTIVSLRFQGRGSRIRLRVWPASQPEPAGWHHEATANHTAAGVVRLTGEAYSGNTNAAPYWLEWDGVELSNPQRVALSARGVNGVQRAWPAGTSVDVWEPAISPL